MEKMLHWAEMVKSEVQFKNKTAANPHLLELGLNLDLFCDHRVVKFLS